MSETSNVEAFLNQAKEREKEYSWLGAVERYKKALGLVPEQDFSRKGEICEWLGYAFYRAAMQAESQEEFRDRMRQTVANYKKAKEFYECSSELGKAPRISRCDAMIAYAGYWLASGVPEKKRLLAECWRLTKEALSGFKEAGNALEYGKTYNQLSTSALFGYFLEWDFQIKEKSLREAVKHGEQAIKLLSTVSDPYELAATYAITACLLEWFGGYHLDLDERERYYQKVPNYWLKANELSEEKAHIELLSYFMVDPESLGWGTGMDTAIMNLSRALEYGKKTKDKFIVGCALDALAYHTFWSAEATEDPDKMAEVANKALQYANGAKCEYSTICFASPRGAALWVEAPYAEHYELLASHEADLRKRRDLLEKALEAAPGALKHAEDCGYPEIIKTAHLVFSRILVDLAKTETSFEEKKGFLEKALVHANECIRFTEQLEPLMYWNRGFGQSYLADIKSELASLAKDPETQKNMLQEAVINKENSLKLCIKHAKFWERKGSVSPLAILGRMQYEYGDLLSRLHQATGDSEHVNRATKAFEEAAETFQKLNLTSRAAECYWKAAQTNDALGEHLKAAENFDHASSTYQNAAEKIPQLKDFYKDHALYMQAWSEIEKARHYHGRQEYGLAKEHFEKAADMHKLLKRWGYLAPNYSAWAQLERAEELSRKEQSNEASQAFEQAAKRFSETKKLLQRELSKIESSDEKQMVSSVVKAADLRSEYSIARATLEEAKILNKKGDHYSSSEKYRSAVEAFEKIVQRLDSEQERKECKFIISLSQAWQKMTQAEAEASTALYAEASQLFEQAKDLGPNEATKMIALGHSRFCKALEAGVKFTDTRDLTLHAMAVKHLESAANYYLKANFQNASEYAKATKSLFDAYLYMDKAAKESDLEKKAKLYMIAEKLLQTSADYYMKAEDPSKQEQVLRLLAKTKEEKELAVSLTEVLHAPIIASTTTFPAPRPTFERAVGLEKFEHAEIQANIITNRKKLKVGESLDLEIELANAGKGTALLSKITETIPEGFEIMEKPETYRVEDHSLNMKGKRLDPLKTEEVKLVVRPRVQGTFTMKPRILYLDENGKNRLHEPEPITITVKELGIRGWLRGEN